MTMMKTPDHSAWAGSCKVFDHFSPSSIIGGLRVHYPEISEFTFQYEGGYVNDPDDPGGCTNMGITIGTLRAWRGDPTLTCDDVKQLTKQEASLIYALNYWDPIWGNKLPIGLSCQVYDWGVNSGPSRSVNGLQQMTGSTPDGIMGPNTLQAAKDYVTSKGIDPVLDEYHDIRQDYYESLSGFAKYGNGWTRRNDDCLTLSKQIANKEPIQLPDINVPDSDLMARVKALESWGSGIGYKITL